MNIQFLVVSLSQASAVCGDTPFKVDTVAQISALTRACRADVTPKRDLCAGFVPRDWTHSQGKYWSEL